MADTWDAVRAEREDLIEDLAGLDESQWDQRSLCGDWTVREVAAHLVDNALTTRLGIVVAMARARFDFDRQNAMGVARTLGDSPAETLANLRAVVDRRTGPPAPVDSRLVEEVVHGEDIRRPLGINHAYAAEAVERSLLYQAKTSVSMGGGKQRIAGVSLRATDADIVIGDGPEVRGPALSLLLVTSGRSAAHVDLDGPGVSRLG
ncbi:maleylpyruvate isomerase family mycothiol-dependent enzyme [Knoellia sp. CPCC 206453]|uniref:maleylpyruvate isomerase family mycothiol-dependent enzyme n=1 Tax=Knoellia pratensis TaxID=3404796 RepID=UPI0036160450